METSIKSVVVRSVATIALAALITGCHRSPTTYNQNQNQFKPGCAGNPYLMKYHCSINQIQTAAENGNADAQYGLGYMYYYGIHTVKDQQTGELWIQRSAAQGQPLAKKAWSLINSNATFTDLHQAASGNESEQAANTIVQQEPDDVDKMNSAVPAEPITNHLPAYKPESQNTADINSGNATNHSSAHSSADAPPPLAENHAKHVIHDPRLSADAKPVVAVPEQSSTPITADNTGGYTIQLMGSDKLSDVKNFMTAHHVGNKTAYFQTKLNGKTWYMLTYGHYQTVAEAEIALRHLAADLQHYRPWVKSFATVQQEVRSQKILS